MGEKSQTLGRVASLIRSASDAIVVAEAGEALLAELREFQPDDHEQERIVWCLRAAARGLVTTAWKVAVRMGGVRA
jgi:hypothetical protein